MKFTILGKFSNDVQTFLNSLSDSELEDYQRTFSGNKAIFDLPEVSDQVIEKIKTFLKVKSIKMEEKNMNLKENYERFFKQNLGAKTEPEKSNLTESEKQRFSNLSKILSGKYPNAPMTLKEGYVYFGSKKIEPIQEFLKKSSLTIQEQVRVFSNSGKKGLI